VNPTLAPAADGRVVVRPSGIPGAGDGLFAAADLPAGERIEVVGLFVPADSPVDRFTRFADTHKFRVGDRLLIPVNEAGMANHSSSPNLVKRIDGDRVFLETTRDVSAGEELFLQYPDSALERMNLV
jgi:uncharacterized protein